MFLLCLTILFVPALASAFSSALMAQHHEAAPQVGHDHHAPAAAGQWDGSPAGVAYSEHNHHLAGLFVLLIGLSELRGALGVPRLAWSRFLLPLAMLGAGGFLMVWSDHEAWPIGDKSFADTYFSDDWETIQHKLYGILLLTVGTIEMLRRTDKMKRLVWGMLLPVFALVGGGMLFLHSHGAHPSAHKIAMHHYAMGTTAILAGLCKVTAETKPQTGRSPWGLAWAALVLVIGVELLLYKE